MTSHGLYFLLEYDDDEGKTVHYEYMGCIHIDKDKTKVEIRSIGG